MRVANRVALEALIEAETRSKTTEEWLEILDESGMPYAAVNDIQATMNHEHGMSHCPSSYLPASSCAARIVERQRTEKEEREKIH